MYDENHQVQIALITKCGSLFALLYLGVNVSRCNLKQVNGTHLNLECTMKLTKFRLQNVASMIMVPCLLYCIWVPISADTLELEWYKGKPRMYAETHQV